MECRSMAKVKAVKVIEVTVGENGNMHITKVSPFDVSVLAGQVTASTSKVYQKALTKYLAFAGTTERALLPLTLVQYRQHLVNDTQLSPATINRELSSVKGILKQACEQGLMIRDLYEGFAAIRGVKNGAMKERSKENARTEISKEDMRKLVMAPNILTITGKMHHALLLTMASTGMRVSEIVGLKLSQIKQVKTGHEIVGLLGKNHTEKRTVKTANEAVEAINVWVELRGFDSEFVFTRAKGQGRSDRDSISTNAAWQVVQKYAKRIGLTDIKPHDFRRFVGTQLANVDVKEAQMQLGHKDARTTLNHYVVKKMRDDLVEGLF